METLTKEQLMNIEGGAIKWGIASIIIGGIAFIVGVIDGILRPLKCN